MRLRLLIQGQPSSSAPICVHPQLPSGQRILPFETREACEISVGRTKYEAVLDCDRGQMGVRDQVGTVNRLSHQFPKDFPVLS
jgi:hypothetical protein